MKTTRGYLPELVFYSSMTRENALRLAAEERWENMVRQNRKIHSRREGK